MGYVPCLYKDSTNNILFFIDCSQVWVLIEGNKRVDVLVVECIGETCSCNVESSFLHSTNTLALGITTKGNTVHNDAWYTKISASSDSPDLNVKRGKYYETCNEIMIEDDCIEVLGTMGTGSTPEVHIIVRPKLHKLLVTREN
jgi:hypothetical protein